jgi:signal transduction histidine kinase/Flp pilus assembly protein TadD
VLPQSDKTAELERKLTSLKGTERVDALNSLSDLLKRTSYEKARDYAKQALTLSKETGYTIGEANALYNLGFTEYTQNNLENAEKYYINAIKIFSLSKNKKETAKLLNNLGLISWRRNQFVTAFQRYRDAENLANSCGAKEHAAEALNYMGLIYWKWSNYSKAIDYFFRALKIKETLDDKFEIGLTLNNIAFVYNEMDQVDQSIIYSNKVLELTDDLSDNYVKGRVLNNLGVSYFKKQDYEKAAYYQNESLKSKQKSGDKSGMAYSYNDLGNVFLALKKYDEALRYFNLSLEIRKQLKDKFGIASVLLSIAQVQKAKGDAAGAQTTCKSALEYALSIGNRRLEANIYRELSGINGLLGNTDLAFRYLNKYSTILDSVWSKESRDKILELSVIYDVSSKDNELRIKNLEIEKEQNKTIYGYVVFFLSTIALLVLYIRYSTVKKVKRQLERVNREIEEKSKALEVAVKSRDRFFSIISHDLKSPFFGLKGLVEILAENNEELTEEEKNLFLVKLNRSVKDIYMLLENLLDWSRLQSKRMEYNPEVFDLNEELSHTIFLLSQNAERKSIKLINKIQEGTNVLADRRMIHSVLQNLISNAIKFTYEKGKVEITTQNLDSVVIINVIDQGMGIPLEFKDKIFQIDSQTTSRGTNDEKGTGLGLIICKELVELNGGQISFVSRENKGTTFTFTLPRAKVQI